MSERFQCKECGGWVSPVNSAFRDLEKEFRSAFGYPEMRRPSQYGIKSLVIPGDVIANLQKGRITPAQVIECAMSKMPRNAKLFPYDMESQGLIRQQHNDSRPYWHWYVIFTSDDWEILPDGAAFPGYEINWKGLDK